MTDLPRTEQRNPRSLALGRLSAREVVELMDAEEAASIEAVRSAAASLANAAEAVAERFIDGGRTIFLGSGTSGRMAIQEVSEIPPTFGVSPERFVALVAGGPTTGPSAITASEDDVEAAPRELEALGVGPRDAVLGLAASGTTPFVVAGVTFAARSGAWTCGIANNAGTPLLAAADVPILLDTGPEVLTGSTRLKAGTAQKLALNRITTAAMVRSGRVVENHMVDVVVTLDKLRERAVRIVADLSGTRPERARRALERSDWCIRRALEALGRGTHA
jgi:N-acetylmuramic acid 6-phosphate etherase